MDDMENPVVIVGAGISGLLLAHYLQRSNIPVQIFERDENLTTRTGWGLTLHLPTLKTLLPDELVEKLPETFVDRAAVERGLASKFPFFDLSSCKLTASAAGDRQRVRVSRQRLRQLLTSGIDIQWGKKFVSSSFASNSVTAHFDDGSSCVGSLLVACDGSHSRVRQALYPNQCEIHQLPIRMLGTILTCSDSQVREMRALDPFCFHATSSQNDTFVYFGVLDAPGNDSETDGKYTVQLVASWPFREGFFNNVLPIDVPPTNVAKLELVKKFATTWAEPFKSFALSIPKDTEVKQINLSDWAPPEGLHGSGPVVLLGDAFHPMTMYRGQGANHAIADVQDFGRIVAPCLSPAAVDRRPNLRAALDTYEDEVIDRARVEVLASRLACVSAHDWSMISSESPLLSRRTIRKEE